MKKLCTFTLLFLCFAISQPIKIQAQGIQEITIYGGILLSPKSNCLLTHQKEYMQGMKDPFVFAISYINECHVDESDQRHRVDEPDQDHRDGYTLLFGEKYILNKRFSLIPLVGPYLWYDTQNTESGSGNFVHGIGLMGSLIGKWQFSENWSLNGRMNIVIVKDNIGTLSLLSGLSYNLPSDLSACKYLPRIPTGNTKNLFSLLSGNSIWEVEYQRSLGEHVKVTALYFFKNKVTNLDKEARSYSATGAAAEVGVGKRFFNNHLEIGIGAGLYDDAQERGSWGDIITTTIVCRINSHLGAQFQVHRVRIVSGQEKGHEEGIDTAGLVYCF